ncbi:MAG: 3'(2'),5'-bisphosphate nucleotidase CysQ [Allorhizobium sp.]
MLEIFEKAAIAAGRAILDVYQAGANVKLKKDASPVTEADERAEEIILAALTANLPDIPVVAEESVAAGKVPDIRGKPFILVDPLDGTKEFINRREDFTVNIAYVANGIPVAGIVYAPAKGVAYVGSAAGAEKLSVTADFTIADRQAIGAREPGPDMVAVASRSHNTPETEAFLRENNISSSTAVGSSLKFCLIAEGLADVYPRFGRTMEWDTAAGDAILRAAGGVTLGLDGLPLPYGKVAQTHDADFANPHFIAWGKRDK